MRLLMLLLVFLAGYTAVGDAQETDAAVEINPLDFVPLEVGNRWTYEHVYVNDWHGNGEPFEIPSDSLTFAEKTVTIEVTHTEVIDGLEYFVFSDADYTWPPLPDFFWAGKKVRLSDEGVLVFRWNGQDIPVYDFGHTEYTRTLPNGSEVRFNRYYAPYQLSRVFFDLSSYPSLLYQGSARIIFLQEYGVGRTYIEYDLGCNRFPFLNELVPLSAVISGEEIVYEQVRLFYYSFKSTGLGQVDQVRMREGFDFSEGKHSEPSNDFELVRRESIFFDFFASAPSGKPACIPYFVSPWLSAKTGVADFGKIDFGLLISKGIPPDLQLDFVTMVNLSEGHTYAVRSREGGVALLYVFDAESLGDDKRGLFDIRFVRNIKFDWIYYPDGLPDADSAVQPISWGQLKNSVLRTK